MDMRLDNLACRKEKIYFWILCVFALLLWFFIAITLAGLFYALIIALFLWLGQGLLIAYLRTETVAITEKQMPVLYKTYLEVCAKLGISRIPELYIFMYV